TDQQISLAQLAVRECDLNLVASLLEGGYPLIPANRSAKLREPLIEDRLKRTPMNEAARRAVSRFLLRNGKLCQQLPFPGTDLTRSDSRSRLAHAIGHTQSFQRLHRVSSERDACAALGKLRALFAAVGLPPDHTKRDSGAQPAEPASNDN